ncbi:contractile injection system tape measure protein [Roseovarius aestuarii]|uniref:Uncharacterized protein n=1 Tax=Roseovarius aestuarii TaxID=475083 RepID=A0A1X7BM40_9RHOB|nr:contractile injection system tape measure protein [Roseovarius aestuarii]SMC10678.1 hypothetical protein ROA7745_00485 [Roseovarius aestuarii]
MTSQPQPHTRDHDPEVNRIGELEFRFDVSDASRQLGAPEKLLMAVRAELLEVIDNTLGEATRDKADIRLAHLDINLGDIPDPPDWQQVRTTLRQRLLAELTPYLYPKPASDDPTMPNKRAWGSGDATHLPATIKETAADRAESPPQSAGPEASDSDHDVMGADTPEPEFKSIRRKPVDDAMGVYDVTESSMPDRESTKRPTSRGHALRQNPGQNQTRSADHDQHAARRFLPLLPEQPASSLHAKPLSDDKSAIQAAGGIPEMLRRLTSDAPDTRVLGILMTDLRWRYRYAPARLREELAALSQHDLAHLSTALDAVTNPEWAQHASLEASSISDAPTLKTDLINRIERALEETASFASETPQITELTAALHGVFPDIGQSRPDPERLRNIAERALHPLTGVAPSTQTVPNKSVPKDTHDRPKTSPLSKSDLTQLTSAELRELIAELLPENATELSGAIDQLDTTSVDPAEALRVVALALLESRPVDLELARRAVRTHDDTAMAAIVALLQALDTPAPEITAFVHERSSQVSRRPNETDAGAPSEDQTNLPPSAQHSLSPTSPMVDDPAPSSLDVVSPADAAPQHRKASATSQRAQDEPHTVYPDEIEDDRRKARPPLPVQPVFTGNRAKSQVGAPEPPLNEAAETDSGPSDTLVPDPAADHTETSADDRAVSPDWIEPTTQRGDNNRKRDRQWVRGNEISDDQSIEWKHAGSGESKATPMAARSVGAPGPTPERQTTDLPPTMQPKDAASKTDEPQSTPGDMAPSGKPDAAKDEPVKDTDPTTGSHLLPKAPHPRETTRTQDTASRPSETEPGSEEPEVKSHKTVDRSDKAGDASADGAGEAAETLRSKEALRHRQAPKETSGTASQTNAGARNPEATDHQITDQDTASVTPSPTNGPGENTEAPSTARAEQTSDTYPPDASLGQQAPEGTVHPSGLSPEDQPESARAAPLRAADTQGTEMRLGALFDAATPEAPRLREMLDLIWSTLSDNAEYNRRDRSRYWQAALVAVLSAPQDRSAQEHAVAAFLSVAEPDDTSRHNLLRVLRARLGYAQPGSDPVLRRETCSVLENLLNGKRDTSTASAEPDPHTSFKTTARAGLVIFHPYLPMLFDRMGLLTPQKHIRPEQLSRAAAALAALADDTPHQMMPDPLERLLLAMPDTAELAPERLPDSDLSLIDSLMRSVLAQWPRLGQTSPAGLREAFIRRTGLLQTDGEAPRLLVDEGPYDMLLDGLRWALSPVALPWMAVPLNVIWRQQDD